MSANAAHRKMYTVGVWALCGAAINFFIGYNMYGERGVRNRVCL